MKKIKLIFGILILLNLGPVILGSFLANSHVSFLVVFLETWKAECIVGTVLLTAMFTIKYLIFKK